MTISARLETPPSKTGIRNPPNPHALGIDPMVSTSKALVGEKKQALVELLCCVTWRLALFNIKLHIGRPLKQNYGPFELHSNYN